VLGKPKLARYYDPGDLAEFVLWYRHFSEPVVLTETITQCRDPKDDYLLSLAISGRADWLVTGDDDLLVLNPFRGVTILRVADTTLA